MCHAVTILQLPDQQIFAGKTAILPVVTQDGELIEARWGKVKSEEGRAINHHCARLESINAGKWNWLKPDKVIIQATSFREIGKDKQAHWHDVPKGFAIMGALIKDGDTYRVYVVTVPVPDEFAEYSKGRWPNLIEA